MAFDSNNIPFGFIKFICLIINNKATLQLGKKM
jgi:hypothetical protein